MTSLTTHVKRFVGPIIANRWTGIVAARVLGNRIPHRGLTIDTSSPVVDPETKAALLVNGYELAEYRFVQRYLPTDCDVIELGGSLGVISCTIRRRIAADRRQFVIEADPRLADVLRRNLAINDCTRGVEIIEAAISYGVGDTVRFALGERSDSGRIAADADGLPTIEVPAVTLAQLIERHGLSDFALVCDIEGVEWRIVEHDLDALAKARIIVMETHGTPDRGSHDDLIAAILATSRFTLLDGYGPVVVLEPEVDVKTRLAIVVTHPIQHFVPFYRAIAADPEIELHVLFGAPIGVQSYYDAEMQSQISWNMDMLGGYSHEFLGAVPEGGQSGVRQPNTPVIAERLAAFAPDVVLVYGHMQANVFRAIWWCRRHKVPLMTIGDSELLRNRTSVTKALKEVVVRAIFRRYSALLSVGDRNAEFYRYYGAPADRIFRSPFTIDEATYRAAKANRAALRTETRAKYDIADDAIVALFVGKLSPRKRPGDLIDALAQTTGRKIIALFAGNGELMGELRAKAAAQGVEARFAGFVNVDKLPGLYAAADMLVHPSQHDPHPLICSEGSCIGLPLILSDRIGAVGPTDIAREGENTIVFPCTDIPALATAIDALAGDDTRRAAMSERSLAIFDQCDVKASVAGLKQGIATARARPR